MSVFNLTVSKIIKIYTADLAEHIVYSRDNRPYCGFAIKLVGRSVYTANGQNHISDSSHIVFLPQGASYTYKIEERGPCIIVDFLADDYPTDIQSLPINDSHVIKNIAVNMQYSWNFKRSGYREICLSSIYQLIYNAVLYEDNAYINHVYQRRIEDGILYLNDHFRDHDLTVTKLAEQAGISEIHFRKQFARIYGMSPKKYIIMMRINYAKDLLDIDELSIQQISEDTGFGDIYSFSKTFRKVVGCSPTEYKSTRFDILQN